MLLKIGQEAARVAGDFSCMAHNLNLIVQNGFKLWNKPNNEYINVTNLYSKYYK